MKKCTLVLIAILFVSTAKSQIQGILFSEYRMILKNNSISALQISNPTQEKRSYTLSFVEKQLNDKGELVAIPDSVPLSTSIKKYLRIFPQTIELAPGESQEIQIQLRVPAQVPDGEYRTYLHFLPLEKSPTVEPNENSSGVKFAIKFRIGAAIPLFYRKNSTLELVEFDSVHLVKGMGNTTLNFTIKKQGTRSTYGNITVTAKSEGKSVVVMDLPSNALYCETNALNMQYPISTEKLDRTADGKINLTLTYYNGENRSDPKSIIYTTKTVEVMPPNN